MPWYEKAQTMRARPVAVIAVSLLLIAGATGFQARGQILHLLGGDRPIPGSAPVALGNTWACPSGGLRAYRSGMVYYPWYYPAAVPVGIKPTRCYRTARDAESAGFRLALPPTGGVVLDGVYLVPAGAQTKSVCQDAANQLGIVIPCPTLLPVEGSQRGFLCPPSPPTPPKCSPNTGTLPDGFLMPFSLTTPPDYPGARPWFGSSQVQMGIVAYLSSSQTAQQNNICTHGNAGPTVMKRPTLWTTCGSPPEGNINLVWEIDNGTYAIGSSDDAAAARRMIQFLASKLVLVSPISG